MTQSDKKEWYKTTWGIILAILILPIFIVWYVWAKSNLNQTWKIVITAIVGIMFISAIMNPPNSTTTATIPQEEIQQLSYEKLGESLEGSTAIITIYTAETEDKNIITLNDKLLNEYKRGRTHIFIRYFNDKDIAKTYFEKVNEEGISEQEADALFMHYIADMKYNTVSGFKELNKNVDGNWQKLKSY